MRPSVHESLFAALLLGGYAVSTYSAAYAQSPPTGVTQSQFAKFIPNPRNAKRVDYTVWNEILGKMVFLTGLSTRQIAQNVDPLVGTKFIAEHDSPYRLEGNKIPFSLLKKEHLQVLQEYKKDLEAIGTTTDISALPKAEQLAYWFNLHNVTVITLIAENYPVHQPSKLQIGPDKQAFHDAKVIEVAGTKLSLRDIRENIVYANWRDPMVIYGFFHGDIGSPSVQQEAFTAENTQRLLAGGAEEFVNSLRSFTRGGVSKLYKDVAPYYFQNFEQDLRDHFNVVMWENVLADVAKVKTLKINPYEYDIADMEGGRGSFVVGNVTMDGRPVRNSQSLAIATYTNQIVQKTKTLLKQGKITRGEVIVGDEELVAEEDEKKRKADPKGLPESIKWVPETINVTQPGNG
jgi:Protein of unknown function, DUF547